MFARVGRESATAKSLSCIEDYIIRYIILKNINICCFTIYNLLFCPVERN